jgi:disulfide bond formation protein DsbB
MALARRAAARSDYQLGAAALFIAIFSILTALGFQHIGGYVPCMLCYLERYAFYAGIPLLFIALVAAAGGYRAAAVALFVLAGLAFVANTGIGIYHAGAEWKFWPGPASCGGGESIAASDLLGALQHTRVVRCDEASLRFLGISFAGWNVVASAIIAVLSFAAAAVARGRRNFA